MCLPFTIRDLLCLTALVAMGVAWWFDSKERIHQHAADEERIKQLQVVAEYHEAVSPKRSSKTSGH
jgi:hypothetical protein